MDGLVWFLVLGSVAAAASSIAWKRRVAVARCKDTLRGQLAEKACDLTVPLAIAGLGYMALACVVQTRDGDAATVGAIRWLEANIRAVYRVAHSLKLGRRGAVLAVAGFALGGWYLRYRGWKGATRRIAVGYRVYARYAKLAERATVAATVLASFTFFAEQSDALGDRLHLHLKKVEAQYDNLVREAGRAIERQSVVPLAARIEASAPPEFKRAVSNWEADQSTRRYLAKSYRALATKDRFSSTPAEVLVKEFGRQRKSMRAILAQLRQATPPREIHLEETVAALGSYPVPDEATSAAIESERAAIRLTEEEEVSPAEGIFADPAGQRLFPAFVEVLSYRAILPLVTHLFEVAPVLEPLVDVGCEAFSDYAGEKAMALARRMLARRMVDKELRGDRTSTEEDVAWRGLDLAEALPVEWGHADPAVLSQLDSAMARQNGESERVVTEAAGEAEVARRRAETRIHEENARLDKQIREMAKRYVQNTSSAREIDGDSVSTFREPEPDPPHDLSGQEYDLSGQEYDLSGQDYEAYKLWLKENFHDLVVSEPHLPSER